ncbi:MAG TPA: hypothetical protein PLZ51_11970, partial [Aggregatilineales bacterium]|nr:hypothetical protein [Aggregatilineales bacterium]
MADMRPLYELLREDKNYRIGWFDAGRTIAVLEIRGPWIWDEAFDIIPYLNKQVASVGHPVYTIYEYNSKSMAFLPRGGSILNIRRLVEIDPPNEQLVVFVKHDSLTRSFVNIIFKVYGLRQIVHKYRFVATWEEAMTQIDQHRASQAP